MPLQDVRVVDVHVRVAQRDEHAPLRAARARARVSRERNARASCCSSSRAASAPHRAAALHAPCSSSSRWVIDIGHVAVRCVANTQGMRERAVPFSHFRKRA